MNMEARTASDREMINRVDGMTAAGLASAAQLIDVTPFMTIRIDQTAVVHPLVIIARETEGRRDGEPVRKMFLTADDDPVLAQLWDNDDDAVFDSL